MTTLQKWLTAKNVRPSHLASQMGRPTSTITRIAKGERIATPEIALAIERATWGEVRAADLLLEALKRAPRR